MKRFLKFAFAAILAVGTIATVFAFSSKEKAPVKTLATVYFDYTGATPPSATTSIDPANWTQVTSLPPSGGGVLNGLTFDNVTYPLVGGKPNFAGQTALRNYVSSNYNNLLVNGVTDPATGITNYF